jgi:hypothetical protein
MMEFQFHGGIHRVAHGLAGKQMSVEPPEHSLAGFRPSTLGVGMMPLEELTL